MHYDKKIAYYTLGCKLNFSETSTIARSLTDLGYGKVDFDETADVYIINTCSVTENADKKCKSLVRSIKKRTTESKVIIIGCFAQLKPKEISEIEGVDLVLGANEKFNIEAHLPLLEQNEGNQFITEEIKTVNTFEGSFSQGERTRSFLKIQDGCDYFCSFCTIPLARGKSRSTSIAKTVKLAKEVAQTEIKEVVITGVNIGDFGKTENGRKRTDENFFQLVQELDKIEGIERWRISSIEPNLLSNEIIDFVAKSQNFVPHFHIPLQSGSDKLLKLMRRKYLSDLYIQRVEKINTLMPDCCIGVDVIVGFPGETEEEFLITYNFLKDLNVSYLHVFTYSERNNTKALDIKPIVPMNVRRERSKMLRSLSLKKKRAFYERFVGETRPVLFESKDDEGNLIGFTDNYIKVCVQTNETLENEIRLVKLDEISKLGYMKATLINENLTLSNISKNEKISE
ncbi:MAG: tRNA (N(6)-L-threonylcarbamoyladenosine(37)-C(2))-methylthiotransferase MtaB [Chitinophagales bacterium]